MVKKFKINYINLGGSNYVDAKDPTKENIAVGKNSVLFLNKGKISEFSLINNNFIPLPEEIIVETNFKQVSTSKILDIKFGLKNDGTILVWGDNKDYFGENFFSNENFSNIIQMSTSNHLIFFRDNVDNQDNDMYQILFIHGKSLTDENFSKKIVKKEIQKIKQIYQTEKYFFILKIIEDDYHTAIYRYEITNNFQSYNLDEYELDDDFKKFYFNDDNINIRLISANDINIVGLLTDNKIIIKFDINDDDDSIDEQYTIVNEDDIYDVGINYNLYKNKKIEVTKPNDEIISFMDIDDVKIQDNVMYIIKESTFYKYDLNTKKLITYNLLQ